MNQDDLEKEIKFLKKRVELLEKENNKRKAFKYLNILFKMALFLLVIYGLWKGYDYVRYEIPNVLEEKINEINPLKRG